MIWGATFLFFVVAVTSASITLQRERRTYEAMIPTRDGVKLHTRFVFPRNFYDVAEDGSVTYKQLTIVMDRSPYGQTGIELLADLFVPVGYISACQDMRGTGDSEGNFTDWQSDANDSEDLGNWLVQQPFSNGKIFTFGASADGLGAFTTNYNSPSWLYNQYYVWTSSIGYEVIYPNGAQLYNLLNRWIKGTVRPADYENSWGQFIENEMRTEWWDTLSFTGNYDLIKKGKFGFWAGWYDIFLVGNLAAYNGFNYHSEEPARYNSVLTVDPCGHCQDAAAYFTENIIEGRTVLALMQAYDTFDVRPVTRTNIKNITFYVMSSNDEAGKQAGQFWSSVEKWPVAKATPFYLHGDGSVSTSKPTMSDGFAESTSFVHDPSTPIPTKGGNNLFSDAPCGPLDQQELDKRSDVVVFQTPVFTDALALTGAINGYLHVSSDAKDTDFMVRISDVYPTGEARLIQDSAVRMRWRNGGLTPEYMKKGEVYPASLSLWNTSYIVAPGHALRFAISSSNYPRFSVNYNNGLLLADAKYPGDKVVATNTIYHSSRYPSYIELPVVNRHQLPQVHGIQAQFEAAYPQVDYKTAVEQGKVLFEKLAASGMGNGRSK